MEGQSIVEAESHNSLFCYLVSHKIRYHLIDKATKRYSVEELH
jgi:hypothetical protein